MKTNLQTQLRTAEKKLRRALDEAQALALEVTRLRFGTSATRILTLEHRCSSALRIPQNSPPLVRFEEAKMLLKLAGIRYYADPLAGGWSIKPAGTLEPRKLLRALNHLGERKLTPGNPKSPLATKRVGSLRYHFTEPKVY